MGLKYNEYVKNNQVDQELADVTSKKNIPESVVKRFDGKSIDDVLESYANLERSYSQQGQEIGALRKTVDNLVTLQSQNVASVADTSKTVEPVKIDDLYDDPEGAIAKVVNKTASKRIEELENQVKVLSVSEKKAQLTGRYPTWQAEIVKPEFGEWVKSSPARSRLAVQADQGDLDSANDLLELWEHNTKSEQEAQKKLQRERQFRDATLETSSPNGVEVPNTYSRSHIMEQRIKAKRGDQVAQRWLQAHAEDIAIAYEEGLLTA